MIMTEDVSDEGHLRIELNDSSDYNTYLGHISKDYDGVLTFYSEEFWNAFTLEDLEVIVDYMKKIGE